jgi:hypothetical protein
VRVCVSPCRRRFNHGTLCVCIVRAACLGINVCDNVCVCVCVVQVAHWQKQAETQGQRLASLLFDKHNKEKVCVCVCVWLYIVSLPLTACVCHIGVST